MGGSKFSGVINYGKEPIIGLLRVIYCHAVTERL